MKKKWKIALISCGICLCGLGQKVFANDQVYQYSDRYKEIEQIVQNKILEEQKRYKTNTVMAGKLNIEHAVHTKGKYQFSHKEQAVLARIVEAEASDKDVKSKVLVANVILNRVKSREFPDSIRKVVFQQDNGTTQFSPISDGRYYRVKIRKSTWKSIRQALQGRDYSKGALYFVEKSMADPDNYSWFERSLEKLFTYEGHSFYK